MIQVLDPEEEVAAQEFEKFEEKLKQQKEQRSEPSGTADAGA